MSGAWIPWAASLHWPAISSGADTVEGMARGRLITIAGGEGAGKSTQARRLAEALGRAGFTVIATREPGGSPGAESIRRLLLEGEGQRWDAESEALLLVAARRDHVQKRIEPALAAGNWVVCDRFADSTLAYQGYGRGLSLAALARQVKGRTHSLDRQASNRQSDRTRPNCRRPAPARSASGHDRGVRPPAAAPRFRHPSAAPPLRAAAAECFPLPANRPARGSR